jgi:uncharacterized RDD family membrane protein YckC
VTQPNPYEAPSAFIDEEPELRADPDGLPPLASRLSRLVAVILDAMSLGIFALFMVMAFPSAFSASGGFEGKLGMAASAGAGLALMGYNIYLLHENGQTLGKMLLNIKIVRSDRRTRATLTRLMLARIVPLWALSFIPYIGGLISLIDPLFIFGDERQCLHDRIADTTVIEDPDADSSPSADISW